MSLLLFLLALVLSDLFTPPGAVVAAFSSIPTHKARTKRYTLSSPVSATTPLPRTDPKYAISLQARKKNQEDDDEEAGSSGIMKDAFRQLDALIQEENKNKSTEKPRKTNITLPPETNFTAPVATLEQEAKVYTEMMTNDLSNDEASTDPLYSDVMQDIVTDMTNEEDDSQQDAQVYTDLMNDMKEQPTDSIPRMDLSTDYDGTQDFMDQALQEALRDVKVNNPSFTESILDDKEIMKEIESIFDRGNDKLMESLQEIRKEQEAFAEANARQTADAAVDDLQTEQMRLQVTEKAMKNMLKRVSDETAQVEQAVQDLKNAQAELDRDPLMKLKFGGPLRQGAFIGFILFSFRSILDSVFSLGDETMLPGALLQGAIAMACALYFFKA